MFAEAYMGRKRRPQPYNRFWQSKKEPVCEPWKDDGSIRIPAKPVLTAII
jgi:hypothetical protein